MNEVVFDFKNKRIVVKGAEAGLLKLAEAAKALAPLLKEVRIISGDGDDEGDEQKSPKDERTGDQVWSGRKPAIRDFARSLPLSNTYQRIAALAYHAVKLDGKTSFSVKEMENWFSLCGFKKPGIMRTAIYDASRKYGYVESKGKDQWVVSTGGENLVIEKLEAQRGG